MAPVLLVNNPAPFADAKGNKHWTPGVGRRPVEGYSLPKRLENWGTRDFQPRITWQIPTVQVHQGDWAVFWLAGRDRRGRPQQAARAMGQIIEPPRDREESLYELQFFANPPIDDQRRPDKRRLAIIEIRAVQTILKATVRAALHNLFYNWKWFQVTDYPLTNDELATFLRWYNLPQPR
jgi:hypothetical protein